jgi:hypothetical protein
MTDSSSIYFQPKKIWYQRKKEKKKKNTLVVEKAPHAIDWEKKSTNLTNTNR